MYIDYVKIGKRIKQCRIECGLTQRQLEELAELPDKYLSTLERTMVSPSHNTIAKVNYALKV